MDTQNRPQWSSNISFVIAAIASAVGLGNIWRFPYVMGQNGGAIFLLVYLITICTICFIPLFSEIIIGKKTRLSPVNAYEKINRHFKIFGWLCVVTSIIICGFYFVVGGWILDYIAKYFIHSPLINNAGYFENFIAQPDTAIIYSICFLLLTAIPCFAGVKSGIEKTNNIIMPIFFIMLLGLAVYCINLPNAHAGLIYMLKPDFSKLNIHTLLMVFGQALFSLSVGIGALVTYGSYLKPDTKITKPVYVLIISDTIAAILSAVVIFAAVFAFGIAPDAGPSLVFKTLPEVFKLMPYGTYIGLLFFIILFIAAVSSAISLMEMSISSIVDNFKISRKIATVIDSMVIVLLMLPTALSFGLLKEFKILGMDLFSLFDYISSNLLMPVNTIIACFIVGYILKPEKSDLTSNELLYQIYIFASRYLIIPLLLIFLIFGLKNG